MHTLLDRPFAALAVADCPAHDQMLVAVEREFAAVDAGAVAEALDEGSRGLFGLSSAPEDDCVRWLSRQAWSLLPGEARSAEAWLVSAAFESEQGSGALRAGGLRALLPA